VSTAKSFAGIRPERSLSLEPLVDIDPVNMHVADGGASDLEAACADYEAEIRAAGGVDLQLLGAGKAEPIARAIEGPLASMCPASAIQLHPHATVVVDEAAAARLTLADYYRATFNAKPSWQSI
jgi:6-phosphogluconolactonase/glucosamine-6-phosphate isomerase/deaminase